MYRQAPGDPGQGTARRAKGASQPGPQESGHAPQEAPVAIHQLQHHCLLWPELPASCGSGNTNQTYLRASLPGEQVAVAQPSVLGPHWDECRRDPLGPLSPHGQQLHLSLQWRERERER